MGLFSFGASLACEYSYSMNKLKAILCSFFLISSLALGQHDHGHGEPTTDTRVAVEYPTAMKEHTLASMRDHLLAISQIQEAMGNGPVSYTHLTLPTILRV